MMQHFFLGLDPGQVADFTALVVAERMPTQPKPSFHVRHLKRYNIGTSYPDIVSDVKTLTGTAPLKGRSTLVIDSTGCGKPVFDLFDDAKLGCALYGVMIHAGDSVTREGRHWRVPKRDLVATIQRLLQSQRLTIAKARPAADT